MTLNINLLPSGHLRCSDESAQESKVASAFKEGVGAGLFALAASRNSTGFSPSAHF